MRRGVEGGPNHLIVCVKVKDIQPDDLRAKTKDQAVPNPTNATLDEPINRTQMKEVAVGAQLETELPDKQTDETSNNKAHIKPHEIVLKDILMNRKLNKSYSEILVLNFSKIA